MSEEVNYVIFGAGLSLPVEGVFGEEAVINRAFNLIHDFPDIKVYKAEGRRFVPVWNFDYLKKTRLRRRQPY